MAYNNAILYNKFICGLSIDLLCYFVWIRSYSHVHENKISPFPDLLVIFLFMLDSLTLSPSSVAACDGELVVFTCTANVGAFVWWITTPTRNYYPLGVSASFVGRMPFNTSDGVFSSASTSYTTSPMELVSTLTTTANRNLDGTVVQCEAGGRSVTTNIM